LHAEIFSRGTQSFGEFVIHVSALLSGGGVLDGKNRSI
jgi:hypothetical protein